MAAYRPDDPRDEGPLADLTSAGMWTTAGAIGASMYLLPGAPHEHLAVGLLIAAVAVSWGAVSLLLYRKRWTMSIGRRTVATVATAPLVATAIWASGGAASFLQPLLLFTALFISYFFPARLAWPLMALFAFVYASPPGRLGVALTTWWVQNSTPSMAPARWRPPRGEPSLMAGRSSRPYQ